MRNLAPWIVVECVRRDETAATNGANAGMLLAQTLPEARHCMRKALSLLVTRREPH